MYGKFVKRFLDIFISLTAIVLLSPLLLLLWILVRSKLGKPALFTQQRPGKNEKIFKLYKFRSMTDERDDKGELLPDEVRLTSFGKLLRASSLDELPELFNILKGDMSLIGPSWSDTFPIIRVRSGTGMMCARGLRDWPRLTGATPLAGRSGLPLTWNM